MVSWALMFAAVVIEHVYGRRALPPLPMEDGCYQVTEEVAIFRMEGEAVILSYPIFKSVLEARNIAPPTASYLITKDNGTESVASEADGRVRQRDKQLWLLPAQASDSGDYVCMYRNETYCISGRISLRVFEFSAVHVPRLSYRISAAVGERLAFSCPSLGDFNRTDRLIEWYKNYSSTALQPGRVGSFPRDSSKLMIPAVRRCHAGVYTCQLRVLIEDRPYKVSRIVLLRVDGEDPAITTAVPDLSMTPDLQLSSSSSSFSSLSTVHAPIIQPPVIVSPLNGTIFESPHGSGLEMPCKVLTECEMAESTAVTWLVNGQSVESSYLDGRAMQGGRSVTRVSEGCQIELRLIVVAMTEEDVNTALRCVTQNRGGRREVVAQLRLEDSSFTWLVVGAVAVSCFLTVVSLFLYVLLRPKRKTKMDYILARQNSSF